jgi:NADH:ubiquinone oxidoreductase subunit 6 (subunit J)
MANVSDSEQSEAGTAAEPSRAEVKAQVAFETERRARLGVPVAAGGVLYLLSGIILTSTLKGIPTVGVLQGLAPALRGEANPAESPRAAEVRFQSHHSFGLLASSVLAALAYGAIVLVLLFLLRSLRFRRPQTGEAARWLALVGGSAVAVLSVITAILLAVKAHHFATGHDFSVHAVEVATMKGNGLFTTLAYLTPLAGIALAAGMIMTVLGGSRVGLLPRWMAMVGGVAAVLLLLPSAGYLDVVPAFWMVSIGILLLERWPSGDPPAWASGEAVPWPSQTDLREAKQGGAMKRDMAPEPALPVKSSSRKRRKRGASR